jgi:hypothetical protein
MVIRQGLRRVDRRDTIVDRKGRDLSSLDPIEKKIREYDIHRTSADRRQQTTNK